MTYYGIPQQEFGNDPNASLAKTSPGDNTYLIAVSNSIPKNLRDYLAIAEYREFVYRGLSEHERGVMAEQDVILSFGG
ncbi:MAG: hypothetical protein ACI83O_000426 [Patescibacteria group bacterium]|jgi:hypothetical protein